MVSVDAACEGMEDEETIKLILSDNGQCLTLEQDEANVCAFGADVYYRVR